MSVSSALSYRISNGSYWGRRYETGFPTAFISAAFCQNTLNFALLKNLKVLFYPKLPDIRKMIAFFESSQFLPACPSDKSST